MALLTGVAGFSFTIAAATMLSAQSLDMGARGLALSNASVNASGLPFESVNPATRNGNAASEVSFSVGQAHALSELRYVTLVLVVPVRSIQVGATLEAFGFDAYRRTTASLAIGFPILQTARFGGRITARHASFRGYGGISEAGVSVGWTADVSEAIAIGGVWRYVGDPAQAGDRILPQKLSFGLEGSVSSDVRVVGALVSESGLDIDIRAGAEIHLTRAVIVRAGSGTSPNRVSFGAGLALDRVSVDGGVSFHPILGPSAALSLSLK